MKELLLFFYVVWIRWLRKFVEEESKFLEICFFLFILFSRGSFVIFNNYN